MRSQQVPTSLRDLVADIIDISQEKETLNLSTRKQDDRDSFRHLPAILAIEGEYGAQFGLQRIPEFTSVALLQAELEKKGVML